MSQGYLNDAEGRYLVDLARHTIEAALDIAGTPPHEPPSEALHEPGASFVTLTMRGDILRGCIGTLIARRSLINDVRANALAAAFEDPRFSPLTQEELPRIRVEVSVLTKPQPLDYEGPQDLVQRLRPDVDGVVIEHGWHRATFLPQVWEQLPTPEEFLSHLCYKAGLPANIWQEGRLKVSIYQVQKFREESH